MQSTVLDQTKSSTAAHYLGNPNVKRDGVQEEWTQKKLLEYKRCMEDPSYFARTYVKIISLEGTNSKGV